MLSLIYLNSGFAKLREYLVTNKKISKLDEP